MILKKPCFVKAIWRLSHALLVSPAEIVPSADSSRRSVGRGPFSRPQTTCPRHMFSAACHEKIYQNLCTKVAFPFTHQQIKKPLKPRIISGMLPFVGDGFMRPLPSRAASCFYSLMTTTAQLQRLCREGKGKQMGVPG